MPAVEVALTAADQSALAYVTLPLCPTAAGALCSSAATSAEIKTAAQQAYNIVKAYQAGGASAAEAQAAIAALVDLVPVSK